MTILLTKLKLNYKLLFDLVHKVILSWTRMNEHITTFKFHIMAAVYLNLQVNWVCLLLVQIKEETKKVAKKINSGQDSEWSGPQ